MSWKFEPDDADCFIALQTDEAGILRSQGHTLTVERANAKLAEWISAAPAVYGSDKDKYWSIDKYQTDTVTARLVCIEPIKKDTAEDLLRELVNQLSKDMRTSPARFELINRARKLLERK